MVNPILSMRQIHFIDFLIAHALYVMSVKSERGWDEIERERERTKEKNPAF